MEARIGHGYGAREREGERGRWREGESAGSATPPTDGLVRTQGELEAIMAELLSGGTACPSTLTGGVARKVRRARNTLWGNRDVRISTGKRGKIFWEIRADLGSRTRCARGAPRAQHYGAGEIVAKDRALRGGLTSLRDSETIGKLRIAVEEFDRGAWRR